MKEGRRLQVKIPAGAQTGTKVRLRGQGQPSYGRGQSGDLYVKVKVAPDPRFERKGDNLYTSVRIDLYTAVLGGEVIVPTLSGDIKLKIPAGSQPGQSIRLRHKGMPKLRNPNEHGDLYAQLKIDLPTEITPRQRDLFDQLRHLEE
jgi:curved DNA-binding protein